MNYVFFFPDEMRAESVGCYGHPLVQTPNYDRLASEGVRFDQCHVQHPVCSPSRCSLMTGWYPHVAGHRTLWHLLRPHQPSMFRYLRDAGYEIIWHGKNDLYAPEYFSLAVDDYDQAEGGHSGPDAFARDEAGYYSFLYEPFSGDVSETKDMRNAQAGIDYIRSRKPNDGGKPFFVYLPLSMPHPPYGAPEPFHDMYDPDDLPDLRPAGLPNKPDYFDLIRQYRALGQIDENVLRKIQAVYFGSISYVDWMLGEVMRALDESGLTEETTIIVSSDHGDWAGDYGLVEKWPSAMDDTMTRVPLIIRAPGNASGHVVGEPVELFDIMPTVLESAGVEAQHTHFARSLCPQLAGAPGDPERAVFCEGGYDPHEPNCYEGHGSEGDVPMNPVGIYYPKALQQQEHPESVCRSTMLRTMTHKLVRRTNGVCELYDMVEDPRELSNVYDDPGYANIRQELESRMLTWLIRTADVVPWDENPRGLPNEEARPIL